MSKQDELDREGSSDMADKNDQFHALTSRERFQRFQTYFKENRGKKKEEEQEGGKKDTQLVGEQNWLEDEQLRKDKETRRRYLKRFYNWLKPYRFTLLLLIITGLMMAAFDVVMPICSKYMVDVITAGDDWRAALPVDLDFGLIDSLILIGGCALVAMLLARLIGFWRDLTMRTLTQLSTNKLRKQLYEHILHLPLDEIQSLKSGGVISRCSTDVDSTVGLVQEAVLSPAMAGLRLLVVTVTLLFINWQVTVAALSLLFIMAGIYHIFLKRVRPIWRSLGQDRQHIDGRVGEAVGGLRVVRSFAREKHEKLQFMLGHHTGLRKTIWATNQQQILFVFWQLLIPMTSLIIVGLGCWMVLEGRMTAGDIVAIQMLAFQVLNPVFQIVHSMTETQRSLAAMERVYEVLDRAHDKPDRVAALPAPEQVEELAVEGLHFAYGKESHDGEARDVEDSAVILKNISCRIGGGEILALVGASGAGKTTFTDLIARFHDPSDGRILLNGHDLRDYQLQGYRSLLGIVQQETVLFDDTVANNISYPMRDANREAIIDAARRANALEFIEDMPQGFDSIIGERGVKLSGGQRQRLAIARALLADPQILILDEATSNLDSESEQAIQAAMDELLKGRTTIIVAHRLSTIQHADQILVFEKGEVVQSGRHNDLMAAGLGTRYYDMVERQRFDLSE